MIPKTYHDANPEDRAYASDYWSWLQQQPQDAWLLWARMANWDNAGSIFKAMVARADCDLALVSWLFWNSDPAYFVATPTRYRPGTLIATIVEHCGQHLYGPSQLFCDRHEVAMQAQKYVKAVRAAPAGSAPFALPRMLCEPFTGRPATLPARYDAQTEDDLREIFRYLNGGLPRSEKEHWERFVAGGGAWLKDQMTLPDVPADPMAAFARLDDAAFVEAIFGKAGDYDAALARHRSGTKPRKSWWPFS